MTHSVHALHKLREMRKKIVNVNDAHRDSLTRLQRLAVWVTDNVGNFGFFLLILAWTIVWLTWNMFAPKSLQFDPFPAFAFWLFISNVIQLFLMPLIMIGQNLQARHSEARAEAEYELNIKAEREIEAVLAHLENQNEILEKIQRKLGA